MVNAMSSWFAFGVKWLPYLLGGVPVALLIWVIAMAFGMLWGMTLAWMRVYAGRVGYMISTAYVEVFRGTPVIIQLFFLYYGLPKFGIYLSPLEASTIAIALDTSAYQAEYFRGSIQAVPKGQIIAARAQGMSALQSFIHIVLPQAIRLVLPQWSNEAIVELKFTSIAYTVGVAEVTARAYKVGFQTYEFFAIFLWAAVIYLILTTIVSELLWLLEKKLAVPGIGLNTGRPEG